MSTMDHAFRAGDAVVVRNDDHPGHHRVPVYLKGRRGVVEFMLCEDRNPETLAYGGDGLPKVPLYRVRFAQKELWPDYAGPGDDSLASDVLEHWLLPAN